MPSLSAARRALLHHAAAAGLFALLCAGCSDATLSEMRPGLKGSSLQCWLTLNLKRLPKSSDVRDLKVTFSSVVLYQDETFDWSYIASHDVTSVKRKGWTGEELESFVPNDDTTPEQDPALGPMKVEFTLPSREKVQVKSGDDTNLNAELYWGGKRQDSMSRGMFLAYQ